MEIEHFLQEKFGSSAHFKPSSKFYESVKIRRRRWGQLVKGEKSPTIIEMQAIAEYFKVPVSTLLPADKPCTHEA